MSELQEYVKLLEARIEKLESFLQPQIIEQERRLQEEKRRIDNWICKVKTITLRSIIDENGEELNRRANLTFTFINLYKGGYYNNIQYIPEHINTIKNCWGEGVMVLPSTKFTLYIYNEDRCSDTIQLGNILFSGSISSNEINLGIRVDLAKKEIYLSEETYYK